MTVEVKSGDATGLATGDGVRVVVKEVEGQAEQR